MADENFYLLAQILLHISFIIVIYLNWSAIYFPSGYDITRSFQIIACILSLNVVHI